MLYSNVYVIANINKYIAYNYWLLSNSAAEITINKKSYGVVYGIFQLILLIIDNSYLLICATISYESLLNNALVNY